MRILLAVPSHLHTVPMGRFSEEALRELGHEVVLFDYHPQPQEKVHDWVAHRAPFMSREEMALLNRRFRRAVDAAKPDLLLTLYGFNLSKESLDHLRRAGVPSACWWINDPFQFERSLRKAGNYDFIFSNCSVSAQKYREASQQNAFFLPVGCLPTIHRAVPAETKYACEVCFAGDWSKLRAEVLTELAGKFEVKIFGPWRKHLPPVSPLRARLVEGFFTPEEMAAMFASAKVVLNLHTWHGRFSHGVNPRLFEAAGCRAFQVVDWKQEIPGLFDVQSEVRCFQTRADLPETIRAALADDAARAQMAAAAQTRAYREHTYRQRMQQLLDVMKLRA